MKTFKDIRFFDSMGGNLKSITEFGNGFSLSVIAGEHAYCEPREASNDPDHFMAFEIAIFNDEGEFVTKDFLLGHDDDVKGWCTRADINTIMMLIQSKK